MDLDGLGKHMAADEVMAATNVRGHAERLRPYERPAEVFEVAVPGK